MSHLTKSNSETLFKNLAAGDEQAFEFLYNRYFNRVDAVATGLVKDSDQAEDFVHEIFLNVWKLRRNFEHKFTTFEDFEYYLLAAVKHATCRYVKRAAHEILVVNEYMKQKASDANATEDDLHTRQYLELVAQCVEKLPSQKKIIFQLVRDEGMSYEDIADKMQLSKNTVRNHMHIAIETISKSMETHLASLTTVLLWIVL